MAFNASVIDVYRHFFAARLDVYSRWTPDGWRPLREEMTVDIVAAGLDKTGPSISGYMIAPGDQTHVAAIDFDLDDGLALARRVASQMRLEGAAAYVEGSRRGAHLWMVLAYACPAIQVRSAIQHWLEVADMPRDPANPRRFHPKIELRPGTDTVGQDGLGHCLRMPLMPHPKTGQRSTIEGPNGSLGSRLSDILLEIELVPTSVVAEAAMKWVPVVSVIPPSYRPSKPVSEDDGASASDILRDLWGVLDARPGRVFSCPAKEYHDHGDVHKGLSILRDDRRVICHKPGCILSNNGRGRGTWELRTMAPRGATRD